MKVITYSLIGILGTILHIGTMLILVEKYSFNETISSGLGFLLTVVVSYYLNKKYTFKNNKQGKNTFIKYIVVSISGLTLNTLIMLVGVEWLGIHYLIPQGIAVISIPISNFLLNNYWTFKEV